MDSATRLQTILVDSPVGAVLPAIALLNLPKWWLAGGAVRNTVWRSLFGNDCQLVINDLTNVNAKIIVNKSEKNQHLP
jgi:hypothetical protein